MREAIARRAGVHPALVRYYFGTTQNLLVALLENWSCENLALLAQVKHVSNDPWVMIEMRIRLLFRMHRKFPHVYDIILQVMNRFRSARAKELRRELIIPYYAEMKWIIETGIREGLFRDVDTRFVHAAVIGMAHIFITNQPFIVELLAPEKCTRETEDGYIAFMADLLIRGISR